MRKGADVTLHVLWSLVPVKLVKLGFHKLLIYGDFYNITTISKGFTENPKQMKHPASVQYIHSVALHEQSRADKVTKADKHLG